MRRWGVLRRPPTKKKKRPKATDHGLLFPPALHHPLSPRALDRWEDPKERRGPARDGGEEPGWPGRGVPCITTNVSICSYQKFLAMDEKCKRHSTISNFSQACTPETEITHSLVFGFRFDRRYITDVVLSFLEKNCRFRAILKKKTPFFCDP